MSSSKQNPYSWMPERVSSASNMMVSLKPLPTENGKRLRRDRSAQGAAHYENGHHSKKGPGVLKSNTDETHIFIRKTYEMINTCEPHLASWTEDGTMFVIKDKDEFAKQVIPKFFNHKVDSFVRQLNFYGFRKVQLQHIYKSHEVNKKSVKHMTFCNENFQRGKEHLLKNIKRSTNKGTKESQNQQEMQKQINSLKEQFATMENDSENRIAILERNYENRIATLEKECANRIATLETHWQLYFSNSLQQHSTSYSTLGNQSHTTNLEPRNVYKNPQTPNKTDNNNKPRVTIPLHQDAKISHAKMPPQPHLNGASKPGGPSDRQCSLNIFIQTAMNNPEPVEAANDAASLKIQQNSNNESCATLPVHHAANISNVKMLLPSFSQTGGLVDERQFSFMRAFSNLSSSDIPPLDGGLVDERQFSFMRAFSNLSSLGIPPLDEISSMEQKKLSQTIKANLDPTSLKSKPDSNESTPTVPLPPPSVTRQLSNSFNKLDLIGNNNLDLSDYPSLTNDV